MEKPFSLRFIRARYSAHSCCTRARADHLHAIFAWRAIKWYNMYAACTHWSRRRIIHNRLSYVRVYGVHACAACTFVVCARECVSVRMLESVRVRINKWQWLTESRVLSRWTSIRATAGLGSADRECSRVHIHIERVIGSRAYSLCVVGVVVARMHTYMHTHMHTHTHTAQCLCAWNITMIFANDHKTVCY